MHTEERITFEDGVLSLIDRFLKENISVSLDEEIMYGSDQAYDSYPCRFATVGLEVDGGYGLCRIVDRMRKTLGFKPLEPLEPLDFDDDYDSDCDQEGEYRFYVGLNDYNASKVDSCITVILINSRSPDNEDSYVIDLSEEEQKALYRRLDEDCRKLLGKSCEDLLEEARNQM